MNDAKQHIFLQRVLFIHDLTKRRAGKAQVLRLSTTEWLAEADLCCCGGYVLEAMRTARDPDNLVMFSVDTVKTVMARFIEGSLGHYLKII